MGKAYQQYSSHFRNCWWSSPFRCCLPPCSYCSSPWRWYPNQRQWSTSCHPPWSGTQASWTLWETQCQGHLSQKTTPPVGSSIHLYQVHKKWAPRHDSIWNQDNTFSICMFNPLTQWYGLAESLDSSNDNKENSTVATMVNINGDLLLPDKPSIFFSLN